MTAPEDPSPKPSECVLWLLDVVTQAKEMLVADEGIGADLPPLVAAFDIDDTPIGYAQAIEMESDRRAQFMRLAKAAAMMRAGWHARSLALVLETYVNLGEDDDDVTLAERFAKGDKDVVEAISIVWASQDGRRLVVSLPYQIGLGRRVTWDHDLKEMIASQDSQGAYPSALRDILRDVQFLSEHPTMTKAYRIADVASSIADDGFYVFFDGS